jgi:hypothetical protein
MLEAREVVAVMLDEPRQLVAAMLDGEPGEAPGRDARRAPARLPHRIDNLNPKKA